MNSKILLISIFLVFLMVIFSGCTSENPGNNSTGDSWLSNYSPVHYLGTENGDFWVDYPPGNPDSGQSVSHLSCVIDSLEEGCVLFVVHKTGCVGCQAQADRVINLAEKYKGQLVFFDLDIPLGGEIEQKAYDAYVYDPDGPPGYIALTGIFTLIENNGNIEYGWHSWEGDLADSDMEAWIQDAIYYYHVNSGG